MEKYTGIIKKSKLFMGMDENEITAILPCLHAKKTCFKKNEYILRLGDNVDSVGMVLAGSVNVIKEDYWGNRNIVAKFIPGQTFAESFASVPDITLGVSAVAGEDCEIMFMNMRRILTTCSSNCSFHNRLIQNMVSLLASKNILMNEKNTLISQRSIRAKLLSYLSNESIKHHTAEFDIPFDRQQLADFLSVDRSALSNELSKMRREGIIIFNKNHFILKEKSKI